MKKIILLSIIVFIVTNNLLACNIGSKNEVSNIWDDESAEKKNLEIVKQMVDKPVSDLFDLYFVTSSFPMIETYYKKLHLEYLKLKNTEKAEIVQQSYFDEITNIADKMKEYEKLYNNYKSSKH